MVRRCQEPFRPVDATPIDSLQVSATAVDGPHIVTIGLCWFLEVFGVWSKPLVGLSWNSEDIVGRQW